jgi:hypothetical protein
MYQKKLTPGGEWGDERHTRTATYQIMLCDHSVDTFRSRYTLEKGTLMSSILIQTTLRGIEKEEGKMAL